MPGALPERYPADPEGTRVARRGRGKEGTQGVLPKSEVLTRTGKQGASLKCYQCNGAGHKARECPNGKVETKKEGQRCHKCGGVGHWATACPTANTSRPEGGRSGNHSQEAAAGKRQSLGWIRESQPRRDLNRRTPGTEDEGENTFGTESGTQEGSIYIQETEAGSYSSAKEGSGEENSVLRGVKKGLTAAKQGRREAG